MDIDPQRKGSFESSSRCLCQISSKSVKNCDRESADRQTHRRTDRDDRGDLIICPMLCYSNGTDKNKKQSAKYGFYYSPEGTNVYGSKDREFELIGSV